MLQIRTPPIHSGGLASTPALRTSGVPGDSSRRRDGSRLHAETSLSTPFIAVTLVGVDDRSDRCVRRQRNDRRDRCRTIEALGRPMQDTLHNTTELSAQIESSTHHKKAYYCQVAFIVFVENG